MQQAGITIQDRTVACRALLREEAAGNLPAAAIELPDGNIVTGRTGELLGAVSAALLNALKILAGIADDGAFFSSADSFAIIRGGHVDVTVLGSLQVDEKGNIANYKIPGKMLPGMGGAMDLVVGARKVIVAMEHTNKGKHKILKECTLPLTAKGQVNLVVTEMGVMKVTPEGLALVEYNPEYTIEEIQAATEAELIIADDLKEMAV